MALPMPGPGALPSAGRSPVAAGRASRPAGSAGAGGGVHAAHDAQAELEVQRSLTKPFFQYADGAERAEVKDLELGLDVLLRYQGAQVAQHLGGGLWKTPPGMPQLWRRQKVAHLDAGDVLVVQHTHGVAVGESSDTRLSPEEVLFTMTSAVPLQARMALMVS